MNPGDFHRLNTFILRTTGMNVPDSNISTVQSFTEGKLKELGIPLAVYLDRLLEDEKELFSFFSAITINETYFFREEKQFAFLRDTLIPFWNDTSREELNLWSASCSSGEEALSLHALMKEYCRRPFRIWASDISRSMLGQFEKGVFRTAAFRTDGKSLAGLMDKVIIRRGEKDFTVDSRIISQISRKTINIFRDDLDGIPPMDFIFFRNTMIYMSPANKVKIAGRLALKLKPRGVLLLSVSETPLVSHPLLALEQKGDVFYFRRKPEDSPVGVKTIPIPVKTDGKVIARPVVTPVKKGELEMCVAIAESMRSDRKSFPGDPGSLASFLKVVELLEEQSLEEAEKLLEQDPALREYPGLRSFFTGYISYSLRRPEKGCTGFRDALREEPALWPARYYMIRCAGNEMGVGDRERELKRILGDIALYIESGRFDFQFLLEGFNARYFEMICLRELEELSKRSESYAHQ